MKKWTLLLIVAGIILTSCGIYKRSDVKDNPVNVQDRVKKNIQEGRGVRFGKGATRGGDFDFATIANTEANYDVNDGGAFDFRQFWHFNLEAFWSQFGS